MDLLNTKKVILYGASSYGQTALESLNKNNIEVAYFVDSDSSKWQTYFGGKPIYSPEKLINESKEEFIILVTSSYYYEIGHYLNKIGWIENINYFCGSGEWRDAPILLNREGAYFVVNLADSRAFSLVTKNLVAQQNLVNFWRNTVESFSPDIVIDVGMNYGEAIFSTSYKNTAQIYGIEANPKLLTYINRSLSFQSNKDQIKIINAAASNDVGQVLNFYIDKKSSGISSLDESEGRELVRVNSLTIDSLFRESKKLQDKKVLFKIDVEGYEYDVLLGMVDVIENSFAVKGFVEIDNLLLKKSCSEYTNYLDFLDKYFAMFLSFEGELKKIDKKYLVTRLNSSERIHTDLILER